MSVKLFTECTACGASGFSGQDSDYDDGRRSLCGECCGTKYLPYRVPANIEALAVSLEQRKKYVLPDNWKKDRKCPECGTNPDRYNCTIDLGGWCPRDDPDAYEPSPYDVVSDQECIDAASLLRAVGGAQKPLTLSLQVIKESIVASCDCMTKTHDPNYHSNNCRYRRLRRACDLITEASLLLTLKETENDRSNAGSEVDGRSDTLATPPRADAVQHSEGTAKPGSGDHEAT